MQPNSFRKHATARRNYFAHAAIVAGIIAIASGNANAQVAVIDAPAEQSANAAVLKQIDQYVMQGKQFEEQVLQYEQMVTSLTDLNLKDLTPNTPLQPIGDPTSLIQAKCSGGSSSPIGSLMTSLTSLVGGPMNQSQQAICAQIVTTQVDKYNKTVDMLNTLNSYTTSLNTLQKAINAIKLMGQSSSANSQASGYSAQLQTQMSDWESQMQADDAIIKTLEDQQSLLTQIALNGNGGSSSILSDALPDTSFQTALNGIQ